MLFPTELALGRLGFAPHPPRAVRAGETPVPESLPESQLESVGGTSQLSTGRWSKICDVKAAPLVFLLPLHGPTLSKNQTKQK